MKIDEKTAATLRRLKLWDHRISRQQYKTLRGQILAGDPDGAMKGLKNIIQRMADRKIES